MDAPPLRSYRFWSEHRGPEQEIERLAAQVELTWPAELRHLRFLGVGDGGDVLELGCGPGLVLSRWREAFPGARLTGLDVDPEILAHARSLPAMEGVHWLEGDATATGLPSERWDVVLARFLWQHLPDPGSAAREALRLLRPGGRLLVVDVDAELWGVARPTFPEVIPLHVKHGRAHAVRGGDRRIGRRLWRLLAEAGFEDVHLDVLAVNSDERGLAPFLPQLDPDRQFPSQPEGALSDGEMAILRSAHERFRASPDPFVMSLLCVATGVRPAGRARDV